VAEFLRRIVEAQPLAEQGLKQKREEVILKEINNNNKN
jgi:hypothetical protein